MDFFRRNYFYDMRGSHERSIPALLIDREQLLTCLRQHADGETETGLRAWNIFYVYFSDDAYLHALAHAERYRRIRFLAAGAHRFLHIKENVYLVAHARMHAVGDDTETDLLVHKSVPAIRRRRSRHHLDDCAERKLTREVLRAGGNDVRIGKRTARGDVWVAVGLFGDGAVPRH